MKTRRSWRNQDRLYKSQGREIFAAAVRERIAPAHAALRLCLLEIEQFHSAAYPKCDGGCPAHEAMAAARAELARAAP